MSSRLDARRLREIASAFLRLGCLSFGGPVAHLGYVRADVVERRRWLDDTRYAELVALCQFLPGPASSQLVFAIGLERAGLAGACVASACFTAPSALLMFAFALGVAGLPAISGSGALHGLRVAAVAVVAHAVVALARSACPDRSRRVLALAAAAVVLAMPSAGVQLGVLAVGALVGLWLGPRAPASPGASRAPVETPGTPSPSSGGAWLALGAYAGLLVLLPALASMTGAPEFAVADVVYRAGALGFGGGHVVLPLLRAELVPRGWITDASFLAGYAAAQAVPGPLFTLATYLGASLDVGLPRALGAAFATFALFLPGFLVVGGALPFWRRLRAHAGAQAALSGSNAAVVGILLAAAYDPVFVEAIFGPLDLALALVAFAALRRGRVSPALVALGAALVGQGVAVLSLG